MKHLILATAFTASALFAQAPKIGNCNVYPADHVWNTPVDTLPVHASSATWVNTIGASASLKADFGAGLWDGGPIGIPFITVPGTQQKYPATFLYWDESDAGPYAVPLTAPIEGGSQSTGDRHAIAVDTDNCILYELYRAFPQTSSWKADSGAIYDLKSYTLRPAGWTSADAAGLPMVPGLVRADEVIAGEIRHAIRFTVPQTQRAYIWPARHYASSLTGTQYPPMGVRFRLKASFNISTFPADDQVILRALKKYGMILADNGSAWYMSGAPDERWNNSNLALLRNVHGSDFEAVDESSLMIDPNSGQAKQAGMSVSVSPSSANVIVQRTQQFTAVVNGNTNQSVTWGVNGVSGGNGTVGYIDASGLYSAPAAVPSPATVTVQATSVATPAVTGSATVTVISGVNISISPTSATLRVNTSVQFQASVTGTSNTGVTWKVNGITGGNSTVGRISATGLYTAPSKAATVTVSATSTADPAKTASASVTIRKR